MILAGTGHRPNKLIEGYSIETFNQLISIAEAWLKKLNPEKVVTGGALGWDQALAMASFNVNIPFVMALPFQGQENQWPDKSKQIYSLLLEASSEIVYVCEPGYMPYKMQKRNEYMVDSSDEILALWNGSKGGTKNCLGYAEKKEKIIHNCWLDYKKLAGLK